MSLGLYILEGQNPVAIDNIIKWAKWFETAKRHVGETFVGKTRISTVFLGIDHSFAEGHHLLFETMVFGQPFNEAMERYSTWEEAEKGHKNWVQKVIGAEQ